MPTTQQVQLDRELLADAEDHACAMKPEWMLITHQNGAGVLWDNSTGNPEEPPPTLTPLVLGVLYCPFCGEHFGEPNEATEAIIEIIEGALACVDNIGYKSYSKDDFEAAMRVKGLFYDGRIQITQLEQP